MQYIARPRRRGLTLTELLVVMAIILLVSAAVIPTALVALGEREVSEAANIVQAAVTLTRDRAISDSQPHGLRLIPDPDLTGPGDPDNPSDLNSFVVAATRIIALEPLPNYSTGRVTALNDVFTFTGVPDAFLPNTPIGNIQRIEVREQKVQTIVLNNGTPAEIPETPTSWYYNIRQGETLRFASSSVSYRIAGPMTAFIDSNGSVMNPERYTNLDNLANNPPSYFRSIPGRVNNFEFLILMDGVDNDQDGYIDEGFDGIDNNGDGIIDPGFDGLDNDGNGLVDDPLEMVLVDTNGPNNSGGIVYSKDPFRSEYEEEALRGPVASTYSITRRPYVAQGARVIELPAGAAIDLTTAVFNNLANPNAERSRVPLDPVTGFVDLLIYPNGQVVPSTPYGFNQAMSETFPYFHLWIADRADIVAPLPDPSLYPRLPFPRRDTDDVMDNSGLTVLEGDYRLVTISPNSAKVSVSEIPLFGRQAITFPSGSGYENYGTVQPVNLPYLEAVRHQETGE